MQVSLNRKLDLLINEFKNPSVTKDKEKTHKTTEIALDFLKEYASELSNNPEISKKCLELIKLMCKQFKARETKRIILIAAKLFPHEITTLKCSDKDILLPSWGKEKLIKENHFFRSLFNPNFNEGQSKKILLNDFGREEMLSILDFIHSDSQVLPNEILDFQDISEFLNKLDRYDFLSLKTKIIDAVTERVKSYENSEEDLQKALAFRSNPFWENDEYFLEVFNKYINRYASSLEAFDNIFDFFQQQDIDDIQIRKKIVYLDLRYFKNMSVDNAIKLIRLIPDLHILHIENSKVINSVFEVINFQKRLHLLDLSDCGNLLDEHLKYLQTLINLESLSLFNCRMISDVGVEYLQPLTNIKELNLTSCRRISNRGLLHLTFLTNLKALILTSTDVVSVQNLRPHTKIEHLNLRFTKITDVGFEAINTFNHLKKLDVSLCILLTDIALERLKPLKSLEIFEIGLSSKFTDKGINELKLTNPNLKVDRTKDF